MKEVERKRKFTDFLQLSQEGVLGSTELARKLGISINTLYNWRKRLHTENYSIQRQKSVQQSPVPSFSRITLGSQKHRSLPSFIEVSVGNSTVIRIPEHVSPEILRVILEHCLDGVKANDIFFFSRRDLLCQQADRLS